MISISATQARSKLHLLLDAAALFHEPIQITGKRHTAVLIAEDDWRSMKEALYLLSNSGIKKSIKKGLKTPVSKCNKILKW